MTKVGFDLDGIIIGRPPLISKSLIEYLYKGHSTQALHYRFPSFLEQQVRKLSHIPGIRSPIEQNLTIIKNCNPQKYQFFIISGRFGFLKNLTYAWLNKYRIMKYFREIHLNLDNEEPHLFKEKMLEKIKVNLFIDDDFDTICYLAPKFKNIHFYWYTNDEDTKLNVSNVTAINNIGKILK